MGWMTFIKAVLHREHKFAPTTWLVGIVTVAYAIWPLDVIPDVIPIAGQLDDLGLWGVLLALMAREKSRFEVAQAKQEEPIKATRIA